MHTAAFRYIADLAKGLNRFRWYEYSVSSSLMIVGIAVLFGCYDMASLLLIGFCNASMCLFGQSREERGRASGVASRGQEIERGGISFPGKRMEAHTQRGRVGFLLLLPHLSGNATAWPACLQASSTR